MADDMGGNDHTRRTAGSVKGHTPARNANDTRTDAARWLLSLFDSLKKMFRGSFDSQGEGRPPADGVTMLPASMPDRTDFPVAGRFVFTRETEIAEPKVNPCALWTN